VQTMVTSAQITRPPTPSRVIGSGLRRLLSLVFLLFAVLAVNSLYLGAVTLAEYATGESYQGGFYLVMFLVHLVLGMVLVLPLVLFGALHMRRALGRPNRYAVRLGLALFAISLGVLLTGVLLTRFGFFEVNDPAVRAPAYWLHVTLPLVVVWLFVLHRLAGPPIRWAIGGRWAVVALVFAGIMLAWQVQTRPLAPAQSDAPPFAPGLARVANVADRIPARHLMDDETCAECHGDIAAQAAGSMHRLSSFNNPAYRFSIDEARVLMLERDGNLDATRFCAVCHDLVPLFDGRFTDPAFDTIGDPSAHAGITCAGCHAITRVNGPLGNGDYTLADPHRYPFAFSASPLLRAVNRQLIKAKPELHKRTWLKPMHRSAEFCSLCHKVHLPYTLNHYKWLRGQNHYDSFLASGVSGHRVDSFYYPERAVSRCAECHMPLVPSDDPAARDFDASGDPSVHNHLFAAGNTGVPHLLGIGEEALEARRRVLEGSARVDLFGLKEGGTIEGRLHAPLRPDVPALQPGRSYLLEVVVRTLTLGHHLTQGTADSNELWLELTVRDGARVIARSGTRGNDGEVDPWAYFLNAYVLDRAGNRVQRRNAQDIFVALYDHQIPPGAASVVHYRLQVPEGAAGPIDIEVRLQYRKFTTAFTRLVQGEAFRGNDLPVVTLGTDRIHLPVEGGPTVAEQSSSILPWQRWNDYGIGLLREGGGAMGSGELRQAEGAFRAVERMGRGEGPVNLARVYLKEGRLEEAAGALERAAVLEPAAQPWTIAWLGARIDRERGRLDSAIKALESIAQNRFADARDRGFDFSYDTRLLNELGRSLYERAREERGADRRDARRALLQRSREWLNRVLNIDPEDVSAHYTLARVFQELGEAQAAATHRALHARYKPDDQAIERAVALHRSRNPAADHAAAAIVVYDPQREPAAQAVAAARSGG
jgi:tetratricopeptide (TPR) repeat protein